MRRDAARLAGGARRRSLLAVFFQDELQGSLPISVRAPTRLAASHPAMPSPASRFAGGAADSLYRRPTAPTSKLSGGNRPSPTAHPYHTTTALAQLETEFFLSRAVGADVTLPRSGLEIMITEDGAGRLDFRFSSWDFLPSLLFVGAHEAVSSVAIGPPPPAVPSL